MSDLATRLLAMSPMIATFKFLSKILPCSLSVKRSSKAWLGCSFVPSPAFTTLASVLSAANFAAPELGWRSTMISVLIAAMLFIVSFRLSPFVTLELDELKFIVSAPSLFAAISKEVLVLVEFS